MIYGNAVGVLNGISSSGAFLCKFTPDGEIVWLRVYRPELEESLQSINQGRTHIPTFMGHCAELPDGRILCSSTSRYRLPDNPIHSEVWLLMLDDQGCLFPDCEESTIITSASSTLPTQEGNIYPNPVDDVLNLSEVSFDEYLIYDMIGRLKQTGTYSPEVNVQDLSDGMYVLQVKEKGRLKSIFKFVKN